MLSTLAGEREEKISYSLSNTNLSPPHHFQLHVHTVLLCALYSLSWTCSTNIETPKDHNKYFRRPALIYIYCVSYHFISVIHFSLPLLLLPLLIVLHVCVQLFTYVFCSFTLTYFVTNIITSCSFSSPYISLLSVLYFPLSIFLFFLSQH